MVHMLIFPLRVVICILLVSVLWLLIRSGKDKDE